MNTIWIAFGVIVLGFVVVCIALNRWNAKLPPEVRKALDEQIKAEQNLW